MNENVENLVLEHLKRFQAGQGRIERKIDDIHRGLANLEAWQASVIQHFGNLVAADAHQQLSADGFNQRLERIEKRLDLVV